jgi:hypothetical protein
MSFWRGLKVGEGALAVRQDLMWEAWADGMGGRGKGKGRTKGKGKGKGKGGNLRGVRGDAAAGTLAAARLGQGSGRGFW